MTNDVHICDLSLEACGLNISRREPTPFIRHDGRRHLPFLVMCGRYDYDSTPFWPIAAFRLHRDAALFLETFMAGEEKRGTTYGPPEVPA